jgi:chaperonin GroEL
MEIKREVFFGDDLHSNLKKGVDILSDSVKITMGPKGRLVLIQRENQHPIITKDGVTVAQSINLIDEVQNLGVKVIKEAASRTAEEAGDGTTTSTVLAQKIYSEGLKMKAAGYQPDLLKQGIEIGLEVIKTNLESQKKEVKSKEELLQVAMISSNGEKEIADLIVSAIEASGADGSIIVEEAKGFKSNLTVVDGFKLSRGFLSPYFVTDKNRMTCEFENPLILLADREFSSIHDLMKPLEMALEASRPILVVANDIEGEALQGLVLNKMKGSLRVCAIKSPGFGSVRHEMLQDIQTIVGGHIVDASFDMNKFEMEHFGQCKKTIIHRTTSMIISYDNNDRKNEILERIDSLKEILENNILENIEKELITNRIQQLAGGISILRIGAATESELIERYDRVDDALHATKAAMQEGILPGGGVALVRTRKAIFDEIKKQKNSDINAGLTIMTRACCEPFKQIIRNGSNSPEEILSKVINSKNDMGYDAREDKLEDMFEIGIVDPYKVVRCAIENAVSAATMLLNVECCMIEFKKQVNDSDNYL